MYNPINLIHCICRAGHAVAQLVVALRYKPKSREFSSRLSQYGPGVDSASNKNEYQKYLLGGKGGQYVGLTTLPSS